MEVQVSTGNIGKNAMYNLARVKESDKHDHALRLIYYVDVFRKVKWGLTMVQLRHGTFAVCLPLPMMSLVTAGITWSSGSKVGTHWIRWAKWWEEVHGGLGDFDNILLACRAAHDGELVKSTMKVARKTM